MFLTPSDFTGKYELHTGMYDTAKLQSYINKYEMRYLRALLGVTLYNEFISDLSTANVPKSPNFQKIFYSFSEDINMYFMLESDGMLEMLKGFIYFEYSKDQMMQQTTYGGVQQTAENSKVLNTLQTLIYNRYNEGIRTYRAIQDYILLNTTLPTSQAVNLSLGGAGTGYVTANGIPTFGGTGSGCFVNVVALAGLVTGVTISNGGTGYTIGDVLTIQTGGNNATIQITYIGKGHFGDFKGQVKRTAYWI